MMKTIEVLLVILLLFGAFLATSQIAVLPSPRQISSPNLRELAKTTLQTLDTKGELSKIAFKAPSDPSWNTLKSSLTYSLPPNIVYNLTVYDIITLSGTVTYSLANSISSNRDYSSVDSETASYFVTSSNVTFTVTPQKILKTLYILNCSDANGWWITGYTARDLALDLQKTLSPYFQTTIMINDTQQLGRILNGTSLVGETVQNAIMINTFGEAVPIPGGYYNSTGVGYDPDNNSYARYCHTLGRRVQTYNWTWVSIVGYPLYYASNTVTFAGSQNTWGIYGMMRIAQAGINAFLQGLDNKTYAYSTTGITGDVGVVQISSNAAYFSNYYGIYPAAYQTSTRALSNSILPIYDLTIDSTYDYVYNPIGNYIPAATYVHSGLGALISIGLARTTDIRVAALALLMHYHPSIYKSEFTASGTSRLIVLQLGQQGAI
jgi:hypothetical protein